MSFINFLVMKPNLRPPFSSLVSGERGLFNVDCFTAVKLTIHNRSKCGRWTWSCHRCCVYL